MADSKAKDAELDKILVQLSRGGVDSMDVDNSTLGTINDRLPKHAGCHWFCSRVDKLTKEAAVFLIRMLAYNGPRAAEWKKYVVECVTNCAECVFALQEAKVQSRYTYFASFEDSVLRTFYAHFIKFELGFILEYLQKQGLTDTSSSPDDKTLADISPAIVYYILSDVKILQDPRIFSILQSHVPKRPVAGLPKDIPPVGLFVLLMAQADEVREWALQQMNTYVITPMPYDHFLPAYTEALAAATNVVSPAPASEQIATPLPLTQISQNQTLLWRAYSIFIRYIPRDTFPWNVVRAVIPHLSDTGPYYLEVLKSFLVVLDRLGPKLWADQGEEYPLVIYSIIKDNPVFSRSLQILEPGQGRWLITWMEAYIKSLNPTVVHAILPLIIQFLCEELQHERYDTVRPTALTVAAQILSVVLYLERGNTALQDADPVWETVDIHASAFVSVAFGRTYLGEQWKEARTHARNLVKLAVKTDVKAIFDVTAKLSSISSPVLLFGPPKVREQLWSKMYETILPNDSDALATIFEHISTIAHMDRLLDAAWADKFRTLAHPEDAQKVLKAINHALSVFRDGYSNAISKHLDFSDSVGALELLQRPGVVKNIMIIMFSPLDSLREPVQGVVGLAFDIDSRPDCLRALLLNFPNAAIEGMTQYLDVFVHAATSMPEACSMSKSLAICLTDVIDVLCSTPNGLVHQTGFLKTINTPGPETLLPKWWTLMCRALVVIFLRTPKWANYFQNDMMTIWMRDALIFGRDMLAQRKTIETAALSLSTQLSTKRISETGKKMVNDLQQVLMDLTKWLRLTDEELLHQAFALLQSLLSCFKETGIKPTDAILEKLQKHINEARSTDPEHLHTRLDATRLSRLQKAISDFTEPKTQAEVEDDNDDIQFISHTVRKRAEEKKPLRLKVGPSHKVMVQQKLSWSKQSDYREAAKTKSSSFTKDDQAKLDSTASIPKFSLSKPAVPTAPAFKLGSDRASTSSSTAAAMEEASESEESEDEGASLEELIRRPQPVIRKPVERRQIIMLDMPTNAKNPALERLNKKEEARRVTMRLKPDISSLHRTILSWNYEHSGPQPPDVNLELHRVPDQFADVHQYRRVFEPLLLMECWAQIQQSKEEPSERFETQVVSRQYTNDWVDLDVIISESVPREWFLLDTDILLIRHPEGSKRYMAKVQSFKNSPTGIQATVRLRLSDSDPGPQGGSTWLLNKVFSLTTLHREYAALMGLPYYDLCDIILKAELAKPARVDSHDVNRTMSAYSLNEPQARAVLSALETDGFSLIQGPPGTGKTSTICGLIQTYLSRRPKPVTAIHVGRNAGPADKVPPKKILLCAPSNAAIDEITLRIKEGMSGPERRTTPPKVVRVGAPRSMNVSVKDVSLDALVEQKLNDDPSAKNSRQDAGNEIALLRSELESVKRLRQAKLDQMASIHDNTTKTLALEEEVRKLNKQKTNLAHQLDKLRDKQKSDNRAVDAITRKYRAEVLFEADVICSTLSGAGHELLEPFDFEMVVIDEAAQAIELSSLIPLKYRCSRCVMVGDPQQLPPTVISQEASKFGYNQSLFVRLQKHRPDAVHLLSIQYRMHPEISLLPSRLFYEGRLLNGPDMGPKTLKPWHANAKFGEYRFYNVRGTEEPGPFRSLVNRSESRVAVALFNRLRQEYSSYDFDFKVGIVTMYRAQVSELRRAFTQQFGANITSIVDFNTVDGFQGQEKDVIILSCVRAGPNLQTVGFLSDVRRMNVALTRAKSSVFVLGNAPSLERSDTYWRRIVQDARERSRLVDADVAYFTTSRAAPSKVVHQAPKPKPASKTSEPPLPPLATPRELAAASRPPPSRVQNLEIGSVNMGPDVPSSIPAALPTPQAGQKRPAEDQEPATTGPQPLAGALQPRNASEHKPRPRPAKKQKQAASLFIPKKRPPPPGGGPGPSNNRRRL